MKPFARRMDLGEWKIPSSVSGLRKTLFNVEPLSDARTKLADFFSILLGAGGQGQGWLIELTAHVVNDTEQRRLADHFGF